MAGDDKETEETNEAPAEEAASSSPTSTSGDDDDGAVEAAQKKKVRLPPRVERALEAARLAAKADRERKGGKWLAVIPLSIAVIFMALLMPRATAPDSVPLPVVDQRVIAEIERADQGRVSSAEAQRLPADVLSVGTTFRALNRGEIHGDDEIARIDARRALDTAMRMLGQRSTLEAELLSLRALQTRRFLDGVAQWEATGETTDDLAELGGLFIQSMQDAGWVQMIGNTRHVVLSETARRVAYKTFWNTTMGVDGRPGFALTLDEQRVMYVFYIQHPHPPEAHRIGLQAERRQATTPESCQRANIEQDRQSQMWLADKIKRFSQIDKSYPAPYALGVIYYRAGRYDLSAEAFNAYTGQHPDGPYALRARNHLKAALAAGL